MSLKSMKGYLASYKEFRSHLSKNIVQHSWMFQPAAQEQLTRRGKRSVSEEGGQTKLITEVSNSQTSSDITARSITLKAGVEGEESPRKDIRAQTGDKTLQLHSM